MCKELNQELQKGKQSATMLAEHLYMMNAGQCQIEVEFNGISYVCDVRMKIQPKAGRFTFKAITLEGHVIEEIEEIEYMQVKEVLAGDIRKIGDQYIIINDNIPVIAIVSDAYLKKTDQKLKNALNWIKDATDIDEDKCKCGRPTGISAIYLHAKQALKEVEKP